MMARVDRRTIIVFFHPGHPNYTMMLQYVQPALAAKGYSFEEIAFNDPAVLSRLSKLLVERGSEIFCFYSMNFYIKELALRNLWIAAQEGFECDQPDELYLHQLLDVPLVVHIYDHPLYLLKYESSAFDGALIFVTGSDMIDFMKKHFQSTCTYIPIPIDAGVPALIPNLTSPDRSNFFARRNEIFCPLNLSVQNLTVEGHWNSIKKLPCARRNRAKRLVDAALYDCLTPLHIVSERLSAAGDPEIELADQLHVLNFIKLWRRTKIVRALIDLPIIVSSDFVPTDLRREFPEKFIRTSMVETLALYETFRYALNSFPLFNEALHDRVYNPMFANSVLITDRNLLSTQLFQDGIDLIYLDYDAADMAAKIRPYLENPERAYQITLNRYEARLNNERLIAQGTSPGLCDTLIEAVKQTWQMRTKRGSDRDQTNVTRKFGGTRSLA